MPRKTVNCDGFVKTGNIYFAMLTEKGRRKPLARKCLAFFDRSELDQVPAVGDRTDIVQLGTGHHVSAGEGQRRVALQRRVAAYLVVVGQTPGPRNVASILDSARELGIRDAQVLEVRDGAPCDLDVESIEAQPRVPRRSGRASLTPMHGLSVRCERPRGACACRAR